MNVFRDGKWEEGSDGKSQGWMDEVTDKGRDGRSDEESFIRVYIMRRVIA